MKKITLFLVLTMFSIVTINAQKTSKQLAEKYISTQGELTFTFQVNNPKDIEMYSNDFSIVNYDPNTKTLIAWANEKQFRLFEEKNIPFQVPLEENEVDASVIYDVTPLSTLNNRRPPTALSFPVNVYPTYEDYEYQMGLFESDNPSLVETFSIGSTGQGDKELLFVKISDNVGTDEQEPKLMLTSSMHGDEIAGYPMMLSLIDYILTVYADTGHADHARVKNLVENAEIWINPSANPDGTYHNSASNTSVTSARRGNGNNIDLNRNYPDNVAGAHSDGEVYQTETIAFMALADANNFVISANFHGGTELVNYPFDNARTNQWTHSDTNWYEAISVEYATHCQTDANSGSTPGAPYNYKASYMTDDDDWDNPGGAYPNDYIQSPGVTHGAEWYRVYGGRQDYMNVYKHCREVTIELSDQKILSESSLDDYWYYNRDALLDFLTQGTYGFRGTVVDDTSGNPIDATITIVGHDTYGSEVLNNITHGDFYRPIEGGNYDILIEAPCFQSQTLSSQTITDGNTVDLGEIRLIPGAAVPAGGNASAVGSTTATVDWNAQTGNTFDFRYREVGAPSWTTIIGLTPNSYDISGLTVGLQYEAQVRSICGAFPASAYSSSILFTTQISYCPSTGDLAYETGVVYVSINTLTNSDGSPKDVSYEHFSSLSTDIEKGTSYDLAIKVDTDGGFDCYTNAWIDWNIDGDFEDAQESYSFPVLNGTNSSSPETIISITVPEIAIAGATRMRIATKYDSSPTSCETNYDGEVEDYTVNIVIGTLSTSENELELATIYPNPFNDSITVKLPSNYSSNDIGLVLYDISGRIITKLDNQTTQGNSLFINNLNEISSGTYFIKITDNDHGNIITKRLIKY